MSTQSYNIFLVEDNPGDRKLTLEAFKELEFNYKIEMAINGSDAIDQLDKLDLEKEDEDLPDLILLDLNMPKKDGIEVLKHLRAHEKWNMIPIIILTTSNTQRDIQRAYANGANCFISKSLDYNEFVNSLKMIEQFWFKTAYLPSFKNPFKTLAH